MFAVLPTGFGKSLCFTCLPSVYDQLYPLEEHSIVIVVTPLTSIMKDQVSCESFLELQQRYAISFMES